MQWLVGEKNGNLILTLSVRRNIDDVCTEEEMQYREAIKNLKDIKQDTFKLFKHVFRRQSL
jgi:spermidine/putrescine-binding protein